MAKSWEYLVYYRIGDLYGNCYVWDLNDGTLTKKVVEAIKSWVAENGGDEVVAWVKAGCPIIIANIIPLQKD